MINSKRNEGEKSTGEYPNLFVFTKSHYPKTNCVAINCPFASQHLIFSYWSVSFYYLRSGNFISGKKSINKGVIRDRDDALESKFQLFLFSGRGGG